MRPWIKCAVYWIETLINKRIDRNFGIGAITVLKTLVEGYVICCKGFSQAFIDSLDFTSCVTRRTLKFPRAKRIFRPFTTLCFVGKKYFKCDAWLIDHCDVANLDRKKSILHYFEMSSCIIFRASPKLFFRQVEFERNNYPCFDMIFDANISLLHELHRAHSPVNCDLLQHIN